MYLQLVTMANDATNHVDNRLRLFRLDNLKSTQNSMRLPVNGGFGITDVTFDLFSEPDKQNAKARSFLEYLAGPTMPESEKEALVARLKNARTVSEVEQSGPGTVE